MKTWKESNDPDFEAKKNRIELYAIADGRAQPGPGDPTVVSCMDEFGPLNLQPHPGKHWAAVSGKHTDPNRTPRRRIRATYTRPNGVRHLMAGYDLNRVRLYAVQNWQSFDSERDGARNCGWRAIRSPNLSNAAAERQWTLITSALWQIRLPNPGSVIPR